MALAHDYDSELGLAVFEGPRNEVAAKKAEIVSTPPTKFAGSSDAAKAARKEWRETRLSKIGITELAIRTVENLNDDGEDEDSKVTQKLYVARNPKAAKQIPGFVRQSSPAKSEDDIAAELFPE